jgi:excinuclease ABC subunit A
VCDWTKTADWIVDLGPEGGDAGRVTIGAPEEIAGNAGSYTGQYLRQVMERRRGAKTAKRPQSAE